MIRIPLLEDSSCIADVFFRVSANIIFDFGFVDNISCQAALVIQWITFFISAITVLSAVDFFFFSRGRRLWLEILLLIYRIFFVVVVSFSSSSGK